MRTTLDIDDTVLAAARSLARNRRISLGAAVSELAFNGLSSPPSDVRLVTPEYSPFPVISGTRLVTDELVAEHVDD